MRHVIRTAVALALVLAACGGSGKESSEDSTAEAPEATSRATALMINPIHDAQVVRGDDGMDHVEYDLLVVSVFGEPVTLSSVVVLGPDGGELTRIEGDALAATTQTLFDKKPSAVVPRVGGRRHRRRRDPAARHRAGPGHPPDHVRPRQGLEDRGDDRPPRDRRARGGDRPPADDRDRARPSRGMVGSPPRRAASRTCTEISASRSTGGASTRPRPSPSTGRGPRGPGSTRATAPRTSSSTPSAPTCTRSPTAPSSGSKTASRSRPRAARRCRRRCPTTAATR